MPVRLWAFFAAFLCSTALADEPETLPNGEISGFTFESGTGAPLSEWVWLVDGEELGTSTDLGVVALSLPGGTYTLQMRGPDGQVLDVGAVRVEPGQVTEVLATIDGTDVRANIEAPPETTAPTEFEVVTGRLAGKLVHDEDGTAVSGARVFVRGLSIEATSDDEGAFELELPIGTWEISVLAPSFATRSVPDLVVNENAETAVEVRMVPAGLALEDFTVRAPRIEGGTAELLAERQSSASVADVLGAEQMSKSGDSTAASALRRVTGLTLVDGKYVYVRGLGERYSSTLLNGGTLPSPEPERRVVPLDLFPAGVLQSVVIQKTFSPDMPGEFGGGVVRLRTRNVPKQPIFSINLSGGYESGTTFTKGAIGRAGPTDFLGVDGGFRELPDSVAEASAQSPLEEGDLFSESGYTSDALEVFGEAMPNEWALNPRTLPPNFGLSISAGTGFEIAGRPVGVLAGISYKNGWDRNVFDRSYYIVGEEGTLEKSHTYTFDEVENSVGLGGIFGLGFEPADGHEIKSTTLLVRSTDHGGRVYEGFNRDVASDIRISRLRWVERMLFMEQLLGTHPLGGEWAPTLNWRYGFAWANRKEPDRREYRYDLEPSSGIWLLSDRPEGNGRFFSELNDQAHDAGLDVTVPLPFLKNRDTKPHLKLGAAIGHKDRAVDTRRFKFFHKGPLSRDEDVRALDPQGAFVPENIGSDGFQFEEFTRSTDNYAANHLVVSGYGLVDIPILPWLRAMAGARVEHSNQLVETFALFDPEQTPVLANLKTTDALPAASLTITPMDKMAVRMAYGRTVSRPDFRELSPATFNDVTGGRQTFGNENLERAVIDNVDLRWEYFPSENEVISASAFYKEFHNPIESIVVVSAQHSVTWDNADRARTVGGELELRKDFSFIHPALTDVFFAGNASLIFSRVELGDNEGIQTSEERPLQGQSPWVVNLQLGYDNPDLGINAAVLYNAFGPRITEVGALGAPDAIERPFHQLDVVAGASLPHGFRVGFQAKNLVDAFVERSQGDTITERWRKGWSMSLRLGWSL